VKTKSKAYLKAEALRNQMNKGLYKTVAKDLSCVVYFGLNPMGKPKAIGYRGRSLKPAFNYFYNEEKARNEKINSFIDECMERNNKYQPKPRTLKVGDVLDSCWGYDQTNRDYYLVTELIGKSMVEIVEIGQHKSHDDIDRGDCSPDPTNIIGKPMKKRADGDRVRIASYASASKMEPIDIINGVKIYDKQYWTAYH